jgi:leader peptidase (prepilin peptidase) / N-methyltransferase
VSASSPQPIGLVAPAVNPTTVAEPGARVAGSERAGLVRHPGLVALLALAVAVLAFTSFPVGAQAAIAAFLAAVLVVLAACDLERGVIPNRIVLPAAAIVLIAGVAFLPGRSLELVLAAVGAAMVFLIPNLLSASAMGMGDVKLALLLGAGLGWGVVGAVVVAFIVMFPVALAALIRGGLAARKATLPFGPFLALGALTILIVSPLAGLGGT